MPCVQYGYYDQALTRTSNLVVGVADDDLPTWKKLCRVHEIDSTNEGNQRRTYPTLKLNNCEKQTVTETSKTLALDINPERLV